MTVQEFEERIFDVINESDDITINDLSVFDESGGLRVTVADGSRFVVKCYCVEESI